MSSFWYLREFEGIPTENEHLELTADTLYLWSTQVVSRERKLLHQDCDLISRSER